MFVDEAYAEFSGTDVSPLLARHPNLVAAAGVVLLTSQPAVVVAFVPLAVAVGLAAWQLSQLGRNFLPQFDEGS